MKKLGDAGGVKRRPQRNNIDGTRIMLDSIIDILRHMFSVFSDFFSAERTQLWTRLKNTTECQPGSGSYHPGS